MHAKKNLRPQMNPPPQGLPPLSLVPELWPTRRRDPAAAGRGRGVPGVAEVQVDGALDQSPRSARSTLARGRHSTRSTLRSASQERQRSRSRSAAFHLPAPICVYLRLFSVFGPIRVHSRFPISYPFAVRLCVRLFFRPIFGIGRSQEWDTTICERRSQ